MSWHLLKFSSNLDNEINLRFTLNCGQAFRWKKHKDEYYCGFDNYVIRLKQLKDSANQVLFFSNDINLQYILNFLNDYFRVNEKLSEKMKKWSQNEIFKELSSKVSGVRLLRQDPVENLFSFICSSNNNISRISKLVCLLSSTYGSELSFIDDDNEMVKCNSFPTIQQLNQSNLDEQLRQLGFGYRAKYISGTKDLLLKTGIESLLEQKFKSYDEAKLYLMQFPGVGAKIADCVLLGSLNHTNAVPVDVHIMKLTQRHFSQYLNFDKPIKSMTPTIYHKIQKVYTDNLQPDAGWAQLVMFASDLNPNRYEESNKQKKRNPKIYKKLK